MKDDTVCEGLERKGVNSKPTGPRPTPSKPQGSVVFEKCRFNKRYDCPPIMTSCELCINNPEYGIERMYADIKQATELLCDAVEEIRNSCAGGDASQRVVYQNIMKFLKGGLT